MYLISSYVYLKGDIFDCHLSIFKRILVNLHFVNLLTKVRVKYTFDNKISLHLDFGRDNDMQFFLNRYFLKQSFYVIFRLKTNYRNSRRIIGTSKILIIHKCTRFFIFIFL